MRTSATCRRGSCSRSPADSRSVGIDVDGAYFRVWSCSGFELFGTPSDDIIIVDGEATTHVKAEAIGESPGGVESAPDFAVQGSMDYDAPYGR